MKIVQTVRSVTTACAVILAVACIAQAAPGGNDTAQRLAALEDQMATVQAELAALHTALDAANLTSVSVKRDVPAGAMVAISAECPSGKTLRLWSYNITGYVGGVSISNDYPRPDLSGYFVRAHGMEPEGGAISIHAVCGPEIVE